MKKNVFYLITGILSFVNAFSGIVGAICMLVVGSGLMDIVFQEVAMTAEDMAILSEMSELYSVMYYFLIAMVLIQIIVCVLIGVNMIKFSNTNEKSGKVILWTVMSFLFSGIVAGVLAIVGYTNGGTEATVTNNNSENQAVNSSSSISEKLKNIQKLREENAITEEEYERMRLKILEDLK